MVAPTAVRRVLVADDAADMRLLLGAVLETEPGLKVVAEATDGAGALACPPGSVDVAVLDASMPGGGPDLVRALRHRHPGVRVVVWSASDDPGVAAAATEAGAAAYVVKGVRIAELVAAVTGEAAG